MPSWIKPLLSGDPSKSGIQRWKERNIALQEATQGTKRREKRREAEPLSELVRAHLDAVWLAVGAAFFIGGVTLVTAGWLGHVAIVATIPPSRAALSDEIIGWCLVAVGVFFSAVGVYVLRAFFRESRLPPTLRQRQDEDAKVRAAVPLSVSETAKTREGFGPS